MGTTNLHDKLTNITPNVSALANDLQTNTQADMMALQIKTSAAKGQLEVLPNSSPNTNFVLVYTNPTPRTSTSQVSSQYSSLLGNSGTRTSLCGTLYNGIVGLDSLLNTAVTGMTNYDNTAFTSSIDVVVQSIQSLGNDVTAMDSSLTAKIKPVQSYIDALDGLVVFFHVLVIIIIGLIIVYVILTKRFRDLFPCCFKQEQEQEQEPAPKISLSMS